jgi:glucoamylase
MKKSKINEFIKTSRQVILDSSLENGAIVAADSSQSLYPPGLQDYRLVWVRDASYTCIAADILGLKEIPDKFFRWCLSRAEGFSQSGIFHNAYNVNGSINGTLIPPDELKVPRKVRQRYLNISHHGTQYQPDQNGILLLAVAGHLNRFKPRNRSNYKKLIQIAADGLCSTWKTDRFIMPYFDLWEERCILPNQKRYHTYSLAVCIAGLQAAIELTGSNKKWLDTEKQMRNVFYQIYSDKKSTIPRTYNISCSVKKSKASLQDTLPDSSLLGLVFPAGLLNPLDEKMQATIAEIIAKNSIGSGGLLRYPDDLYCGGVKNGWVTLTGAGAWPILSFWMSIYFSLCGDKKNALKHFLWPLRRLEKYFPEQIFEKKAKCSISPLVWSASMFIIAADYLGYLQ